MRKRFAFIIKDFTIIIDAIKLAASRGKQPGESYEDEIFELAEERPGAIEFLGSTDDTERIKANLRENGVYKVSKVLDLRTDKSNDIDLKKEDEGDKND